MTKHEQNISYYQTCLRLHKCVRCGNQDARTLIGKPLCFDCIEIKRTETKPYDQTNAQNTLKQKCIASNTCTMCRKRKTDGFHKTCVYCREKYKKRYYDKLSSDGKIRRAEAAEYGLCSKCLTKPRYKNYNTCYECYTELVNRFKGTQGKSRWDTIIKADIAKRS